MKVNIIIICLQGAISKWEVHQRLHSSAATRSSYATHSYLWACDPPLSGLVPCTWTYQETSWTYACCELAAPAEAFPVPHLYPDKVPGLRVGEAQGMQSSGYVACVEVADSWHDVWVLLMLLKDLSAVVPGAFCQLVSQEEGADGKGEFTDVVSLLMADAVEPLGDASTRQDYLTRWHLAAESNYTDELVGRVWLHEGEVVTFACNKEAGEYAYWVEGALTASLEKWIETEVCGQVLYSNHYEGVALVPPAAALLLTAADLCGVPLPEATYTLAMKDKRTLLQKWIRFHTLEAPLTCSKWGALEKGNATPSLSASAVVLRSPHSCRYTKTLVASDMYNEKTESQLFQQAVDSVCAAHKQKRLLRVRLPSLPRYLFLLLFTAVLPHTSAMERLKLLFTGDGGEKALPTELRLGVQLLWALERWQRYGAIVKQSSPRMRGPGGALCSPTAYTLMQQHVREAALVSRMYSQYKVFLKAQAGSTTGEETGGAVTPATALLDRGPYDRFLALLQQQVLAPYAEDYRGGSLAWIPAWLSAAEAALYDPGVAPPTTTASSLYEHMYSAFHDTMMASAEGEEDNAAGGFSSVLSSPADADNGADDDSTSSSASGELRETCAALDSYFEEDQVCLKSCSQSCAKGKDKLEEGALNPLLFGWMKQLAAERQ